MIKVAVLKSFFPSIKLDIERWRFNEQAQLYVSNKGRVRRKNGTLIEFKVRRDNGYISVYTKESGFWSVHQLVAQTWIPNSDPTKNTVDHLDHNKRNNRVENLEWCTVTENRSRAERDLCYDPDEADRLINKYNHENTLLKKEVAKLKSENTKMMVSLTKNNETVEQMTANMSDTPIVVCNGIPISKRELELVCMAGNFGSKYAKRIRNFIEGINANETIRVGGMQFTRV